MDAGLSFARAGLLRFSPSIGSHASFRTRAGHFRFSPSSALIAALQRTDRYVFEGERHRRNGRYISFQWLRRRALRNKNNAIVHLRQSQVCIVLGVLIGIVDGADHPMQSRF